MVLCLVGGVLFGSLRKFKDYNVFIRASAMQVQHYAIMAEEVIVGNFSQKFQFKTLEDCMLFIN